MTDPADPDLVKITPFLLQQRKEDMPAFSILRQAEFGYGWLGQFRGDATQIMNVVMKSSGFAALYTEAHHCTVEGPPGE